MSPPPPIDNNGTYPASAPDFPASSHANVVAGKIAESIIGMFSVMLLLYLIILALNRKRPLQSLNGWTDAYEVWLEERYEEGFESIVENIGEFVEILRAPLPEPERRRPHNVRPVAAAYQDPRARGRR